jgi:hypothetical protein
MAKTPEERIGIVETEVNTLVKSDDDQWTAINRIREYMRKLVPIWVTVVLMVASGITGSALTFAGMIVRMSK